MKKHGGYVGKNREDVIDFSVNINPLGVPEKLVTKLKKSIDKLDSYPEIDGLNAREIISKHISISKKNIILGNGATELIYLFAKAFDLEKVLIIEPTFTEYERAFNMNNSKVYHFETRERDNFKVDIQSLVTQIKSIKPDLIVMCNPNNPTGVFTDLDDFNSVIDSLKTMGCMLFVDESFIDFTDKESYISKIDELDVFLLRSMTKLYAVPGLRIGYGLGSEYIIDKLNQYKEPWTINSLALDSVELLLNDSDYLRETEAWYRSEKEFLKLELKKIDDLKIYESEGNFLLCRLKKLKSKQLKDFLLSKGIYIRTCEDFYGLDESFIRLAVRTHRENLSLLNSLYNFFALLS